MTFDYTDKDARRHADCWFSGVMRAGRLSEAASWDEIWEAGPYYERVAGILESASHFAIFTGWQIDSRLRLPGRKGAPEALRDKVLRLCEARPGLHFYFLIWDHAYFFVPERELWQFRVWEELHPRVHFIFDNRHPLGASHHEKVCIVDGRVALCGGIDLCDERWDSPEHRFRDSRRSLEGDRERFGPYHDLAVEVTGPVVREILEHIAIRWRELTNIPFPESEAESEGGTETESEAEAESLHRVIVSRTVAGIDSRKPLVREVEFLFRDLIQAVEKRIILEGQYYWSETINDLLIARMIDRRDTGFEVILILAQIHRLKSLSRQMASFELELLASLKETAQATGTKLILGTPYVLSPDGSGEPPKPVYIHSKVAVIDDRFLSIGSANLASRALRLDTELGLTLEATRESERRHIREFAERLLEHWHLTKTSARPDFQLRSFRPRMELDFHSFLTRLPVWRPLFDPALPWLHPVKRKALGLFARRPEAAVYGVLLAWATGVTVACALSGVAELPYPRIVLPALFTAALASAWLIPLPFFLLSVLAFVWLRERQALLIIFSSFWVDALLGYSAARIFPTPAARFYGRGKPRAKQPWRPLGERRFRALIGFLANPLVSIRSKIAGQGLYSIPFPWFALGTCLLLPAALAVLARALANWIKA